ncbi:7-cyano-7-deazaguanine synthase [Longispora sp. K20-0274]|uniref:7-cyano-7-deazaguanine synthase n=1 Tax=Longispora sp. K20-0274 TaxID=3088255 RepID=UPI00399A8BA7
MSVHEASPTRDHPTFVLSSGGIASTVLAHHLHAQGRRIVLVHCAHPAVPRAEIEYVRSTAFRLCVGYRTALIDTGPHGYRQHHLLAAAASVIDDGAALRCAAGSDTDYGMLQWPRFAPTRAGGPRRRMVTVTAPFLDLNLADILALGLRLGVRVSATWSCERDTHHHCGTCPGCRRRRLAFATTRADDPTEYLSTAPPEPLAPPARRLSTALGGVRRAAAVPTTLAA